MKRIILLGIISILLELIIVPVVGYYNTIPRNTDCMLIYIKSGAKKGYIFKLINNKYHIDKDKIYIDKYLIGYAEGCNIKTNNLIVTLANTNYCYISKILIKLNL